MPTPQISFIRLSEAARVVAIADISIENEISVEILPEAGAISRVGISRLELANKASLSLFWFNLPQNPPPSTQGSIRVELGGSTLQALHEISLDDFLVRFLPSQRDIASFFDLLLRVFVRGVDLEQDQGFVALLNAFCERHASGQVHCFHARDFRAILRLHRRSNRESNCKAVALIGNKIGVVPPANSFQSFGVYEGSFLIPIDAPPLLLRSKFCILVLDDAIVVAALVTHSYSSIQELVTRTGILQPDVCAALHTCGNAAQQRLISRAAASLPSKSSVSLSAPNQVRFDLQTVISLRSGLFVAGWRIDPSSSIESVVVADFSLKESQVNQVWKSYKSHIAVDGRDYYVEKFVAYLPRKPNNEGSIRPTLLVKMVDGEVHALTAPMESTDPVLQRKAIIDHVEERVLDLPLFEQVFLAAIAPLQERINSGQTIEENLHFSSFSSRKVSIVIPLYRNFDFIRHQLFAFYSDPFIREQCEIVYVNDDPAYGPDLKALIEGYSQLFALDIRLLLLAQNGGYALANNKAVTVAVGNVLVLMNSDIVPEAPGWLSGLIQRLQESPKYSVIGPKLLYADDTLQHAGMYFLKHYSGFWQNMHYYKGYGRDFPPANEEESVGAVTGACLILHKSDYVDVGGFSTDYVIGDYEDSDLCFKLRRKGGICLYTPSSALYHFERQSMQTNTLRNDSTTSAYNRALNFLKWKDSGLEAGYLKE